MIEAVSSFSSPNLNGELGKNIRMLQACSLLPGFVDIYAGDTHPIAHHGEKILRVTCNKLPSLFLYLFIAYTGMPKEADLKDKSRG